MLDYKLIEALAAVVEAGGFDKAARQLHLTQSAVSQRIRLLEDQTGQVLIVRTTPPVATVAGRQMIKHFLQVKRLEDDLLDHFTPADDRDFALLPIGINQDSLVFWFLDAMVEFLKTEKVLLDLRSEDQELTQQFLKNGEVIGAISSREQPIQGCRAEYLGCMNYRMLAAPDYIRKWFPDGVTRDSCKVSPILVFNHKDELQHRFLEQQLGDIPENLHLHYIPSSERFVDLILAGLGCGMIPEQQGRTHMEAGTLVEVVPGNIVRVRLFWHYWNLKSPLLERLTSHLVKQAEDLL